MCVFTGHRKEITAVGSDVHRLLNLGRRFDPIEIAFNIEGLVQSGSVFQVQFVRIMDPETNLQV